MKFLAELFKCANANRYKGVRKPTCGCISCNARYFFNRQQPAARKPKTTTQD